MSVGQPSSKVTYLPDEHDRQLAALYGQTDAEQPADAIDRRILAAARAAAVENKTKPSVARRRVPLSLAATILVMVGLVPLLLWNLQLRNDRVAELVAPPVRPIPAEAESKAQQQDVMPAARQKAMEAAPDTVLSLPPQSTPPAVEEASPEPGVPSPEQQRLDEISALIAAGQDARAWQQFHDFRREYAGYRIPDDLLNELAGVRARLLERAVEQ